MGLMGGIGHLLDGPRADRVLGWGESRASWPASRLAVLTFHRIDEPGTDGRYAGLISATPEEFERAVTTVANRYTLVSIDDVLAAIRGEAALPDRAVLLSFDDAVDDFETHALPVLRAVGAPAVVFVPTGFVEQPDGVFWWDALSAATTLGAPGTVDTPVGPVALTGAAERRAAYRRLRDHCLTLASPDATDLAVTLCASVGVEPPRSRVLGWDSLRRLEAAGIRCCPHTRGHVHLDHLDADAIRDEVAGSFEDLRRELGDVAPAFAYPAGRVTPAVVEAVAGSGIEVAFTTRKGANVIGTTHPLLLSRVNVSRRTGLGVARAQLLPVADRFLARLS